MDFLQRLASAALGEADSLRVALPDRYGPTALAAGGEEEPASEEAVRVAEPPDDPEREPEVHSAPRAAAVAIQIPRPEARTRAAEPPGEEPAAVGEPRKPQLASPLAELARRLREAPEPAAGAASRPTAPDRPQSPARRPERRAPAPIHAVLDASRLARAGAEPAASAAPVIHVTIDRIDVRAPAGASSPRREAPATARPEPGRSLSDYLRGGRP